MTWQSHFPFLLWDRSHKEHFFESCACDNNTSLRLKQQKQSLTKGTYTCRWHFSDSKEQWGCINLLYSPRNVAVNCARIGTRGLLVLHFHSEERVTWPPGTVVTGFCFVRRLKHRLIKQRSLEINKKLLWFFFSALIKSWSLIKQKLSGRAGDGNSVAPCPTHCFFICWDILALHFYKMPWNAFLLLIHSYIKKKKNRQKWTEVLWNLEAIDIHVTFRRSKVYFRPSTSLPSCSLLSPNTESSQGLIHGLCDYNKSHLGHTAVYHASALHALSASTTGFSVPALCSSFWLQWLIK